jgi:hypothetical protein
MVELKTVGDLRQTEGDPARLSRKIDQVALDESHRRGRMRYTRGVTK